MYQPKIKDELIQRLYHLAKAQSMPMTHLVNQLLTSGIEQLEHEAHRVSDPPAVDYAKRPRQGRKV